MFQQKKSNFKKSDLQTTKLSSRPISSGIILGLIFLFSALLSVSIYKTLHSNGIEVDQLTKSIIGFCLGCILFIIIVPTLLGIPEGKTSIKEYLRTIGIKRPQSIKNTLIITGPCVIILFMSWLMASLTYQLLILKWPINYFVIRLIDPSKAFPPMNWAMITSIVVIFEEVALRGIFLTMLLQRYSEKKSIFLSGLAFGLLHSMNILNGSLTVELLLGVIFQIIYATVYGIFYGYLFIKIDYNLIPLMILHYIGDAFISFFWFTPNTSFMEFQILMLLFYIGLVPTTLSIAWVKVSSNFFDKSKEKITNGLEI